MIKSFNRSVRTAAALAALGSGVMLADVALMGEARAQDAGYDQPIGDVDLDTFHRELAPFGEWFTHQRWGTVWRPNVDEDWRPYTRGHWANSEEHGWVWVAEEEWGWAPFHYGRWVHDDDEDEWLWIPGTEWAPAWVMWRHSDDLVGWAPLPPDAVWDAGYGLRFAGTAYEGPRYYSYWSFVRPEYMIAPGLYRYLIPRAQYGSFWGRTTWVRDHHRFVNGRVFHAGIDRRWLEQRVHRPIPTVTLHSARSPREAMQVRRNPGEISMFRPRVTSLAPSPDWARRGAPSRPAAGVGAGDRNFRGGTPMPTPPEGRSVRVGPPPSIAPPPDRPRFDNRSAPFERPPVDRRVTERPAVQPPVIQPRVQTLPSAPPPQRDIRREGRPMPPADRAQAQPPQRQAQPQPQAQPRTAPQSPRGGQNGGQERRGPQPQPDRVEPRG